MRARTLIARGALVGSIGLAIVGAPAAAHAAPRCWTLGTPIVRVVFAGERWDGALEDGVLEHLRAGLSPQGFSVCGASEVPNESDAIATIELRQTSGERIAATIEVRDGVTEKRVARDIELSSLPPDGRALAVGVAADELLRASWIELSLADAPRPKNPPPEAAVRAVDHTLGRHESRSLVTLAFTGQSFSGRFVLLGGELAFRRYLVPRFSLEVGLGVAESRPFATDDGTIHASSLSTSVAGLFDVARSGAFRASFAATAHVASLGARGVPNAGGAGRSDSAVSVFARAGVTLSVDVTSSFALVGRVAAGLPVRAVSASDAGSTVVGASGLEWSGAVGPAVVF